ncbi:MAG: UDP-glucose 4-epimerase [Thermoleophilaceae bacterium]|jgi:UDP-glucose 4-epimerase|nr:UDP-glucose 4-epimerase [Thermoleophilaceae bacterium]
MKRVLVTGGAGFIGSVVVDRLREAGYEPRILDIRCSPHHARGEIDTVIGDVCKLEDVERAMEDCDIVVHMAAAADVNEVVKTPAESEQLNSRATLNVLEAARTVGVERVVYASTIWVYSDVDATSVDEDTPLMPPAHLYSATKLAGELYCRSYAEMYDVEYTVLRFGIPYGPRARPAAVVPAFVGKALSGEPLTVAGGGLQSRRFVYVEDLADGVVRSLQPAAANRVYNLVGSEDVTILEIASTVQSLVGDVEIQHVDGRGADFKGVEVDGSRAERELGWRAQTPFREGVRRYIAWHREQEQPEPARPARLTRESLMGAARVAAAMLMAASVGIVAAGIASVNSLDDSADRASFVMMIVLLMLPLVLVADFDWERGRRRALGRVLSLGAVASIAAVVFPSPASVVRAAHAHEVSMLILILAASAILVIAVRYTRSDPEGAPDSA